MAEKLTPTTTINCFSCEHFHITYEAKFPYGCRVMGFKSVRMPSVDVFVNSEMDCNLFTLKERMKKV
jgi:hypothetical protein